MSLKVRRLMALAASACVVGAVAFSAAPAFGLTFVFNEYAVSGTLTPKKLNEPVTLPKGSRFNGTAVFESLPPTPNWGGTVQGHMTVPPFEATLKLGGLVPSTVKTTFTEVGTSTGTIGEAPEADCVGAILPGPCTNMKVTAKAIIGIAGVGLAGINEPTECQTAEPVVFELSKNLTFVELLELGPHFTGTVTIPEIHCGGLEGLIEGPLLTTLMSGPENPYALYIAPREPAAPSIEAEPASSTTQVSAQFNSRVDPNGASLTACSFEYGTTASYGASVPCQPAPSTIKKIFTGNFVSGQAANLEEGKLYHYRVVVTNSVGTTQGPDQTLNTLTSAGGPEYGRCVAQKKGEYSDGGCTTVAAKKGVPDHKGSFEWIPGPATATCVVQKKGEYTDSGCTTKSAKAKKGGFELLPSAGPGYTSTSGPVTLETPGLSSTVKCASSSATGEVTGATAGTLRVTFSGCEAAGKKCTSEGANSTPSGTPGVIVSNLLDTRPIGTLTGVFVQLTSAQHAPYSSEFGCEGSVYRTTGSLAGVQAGDVGAMSATSTTKFAFDEGEQALYTEQQSGSSWTAPDPTTVTGTFSNTAASVTEIR